MKYQNVASLFGGDPAEIAFFSTFQFDPTFFEQRVLRCPSLVKARRIAVFMDARQWNDMLRQDVTARWLNRRYLVLPVHRSHGVFHPKLNLLLTEKGGQLQCGSNNLTRSGCSSNLELVNVIPFKINGGYEQELSLAGRAFDFFRKATENIDDELARIATEWLDETQHNHSWLGASKRKTHNDQIELLHSFDGDLWDHIVSHLSDTPPKKLFVISPFHDADCEMIERMRHQWPRCRIELLVQSGYTNLPIKPFKRIGSKIKLFGLQNTSRRLHAKLIAWETSSGKGCLVGSANLTTAALDGRNVEACLLISDASDLLDSLFDKQLSKKALKIKDFEPGFETEPEPRKTAHPPLRIISAVMEGTNKIKVAYKEALGDDNTVLRLTLRTPAEPQPRTSLKLRSRKAGKETVTLPENAISDIHGTILATLVAESKTGRHESDPVWVIQEARLTYEPGEGSSSSTQTKVEETGEGLAEYLEEIGKRDGLAAVVDYLKHLNIQFFDGAGGLTGRGKSPPRVHDPFQTDVPPEWLIAANDPSKDFEQTLYEFVDRHEKRRLRRHAKRGNINGMSNFLDILTAMIRLLYVYYRRKVVKRNALIGRLCEYIEIATGEIDEDDKESRGYLLAVAANLSGDTTLLREACHETAFLAHIRAALLIVQSVRFEVKDPLDYRSSPKRPRDVLTRWSGIITKAYRAAKVGTPSKSEIRQALETYRMFTPAEINRLVAELP
jgi:hypothetical protein